MSLAEGASARIVYKPYASGVISANTEPAIASEPGASGGQILRRVSSSIKLAKDTYQSNEIRADKQVSDFRHGTRRVTGSISGELSPLTYADFFEAAFRGSWTAPVTLSETQLTSVAADNASSTLIFGDGDPVALGLRVGQVINLANTSDPDDSGKNFVLLGFGGTSNRTVTVYPAPDTMSADTAFTLATQGKRLIVPSSGHVKRKFGIEIFNEDIDVSRLFTECRIGGFTIQLPASGMSTVEFPVMGRNMQLLSGAAAPYFTAPASETTTGIMAAVNGLVRVNGVTQGVITGASIQMDLSASADPVVGQNFVPEVFEGRANVTGQITAFFQDGTLVQNFVNEDEISLLFFLTSTNAPDSPAMTILLPRVKFSDADVANSGESGQAITIPYQALKGTGTAGVDATTIALVDSELV